MKKVLLVVAIIIGVLLLTACGSEEKVTFNQESAFHKAQSFINESGSMNVIVETLDSIEYATNDAEAVIFQVRLGNDSMSAGNTDFIKVWKNEDSSRYQVSWSNEDEYNQKQES